MIYFAILGLPVILAFLSDRSRGCLSIGLFVAALLVPCLFAAVRDTSVGTDVMTYAYWTFYSAKNASLGSFLAEYSSLSAFGFNLLSWIIAKLGTFEIYLGLIQAFTVFPMCCFAKKMYPDSSWAAVAVYMLLLFPISLNAMKQMIAVALCVPAFIFIEKRKPLVFLSVVMASAILFHQTAVVALFYWPAVQSVRSIGDKGAFFGRAQGFAVLLSVAIIFGIAFVLGNRLILLFSSLKDSYSYQVNASGTRLNYSSLVLLFGTLFIYLFKRWSSRNNADSGDFDSLFAIISIVGVLAMQLNIVADSLIRFSYYLISFFPLFGSELAREDKGRIPFCALLLVCLFIAYFIQTIVINGGNEVYPYTSILLGIN